MKRGRGRDEERERKRGRGRGREGEEEREKKRGRGREGEEEMKRGRGREREEERGYSSHTLLENRTKDLQISSLSMKSQTQQLQYTKFWNLRSTILSFSFSPVRSASSKSISSPKGINSN